MWFLFCVLVYFFNLHDTSIAVTSYRRKAVVRTGITQQGQTFPARSHDHAGRTYRAPCRAPRTGRSIRGEGGHNFRVPRPDGVFGSVPSQGVDGTAVGSMCLQHVHERQVVLPRGFHEKCVALWVTDVVDVYAVR
jgi:hypothetical protein